MRVIRMPITAELLEQVLRMPPDMQIVGCAATAIDDSNATTIELFVHHPSFADVEPNKEHNMPTATPVLTKHQERIEWKVGDLALGDGR